MKNDQQNANASTQPEPDMVAQRDSINYPVAMATDEMRFEFGGAPALQRTVEELNRPFRQSRSNAVGSTPTPPGEPRRDSSGHTKYPQETS
jgi:hypothetical protein